MVRFKNLRDRAQLLIRSARGRFASQQLGLFSDEVAEIAETRKALRSELNTVRNQVEVLQDIQSKLLIGSWALTPGRPVVYPVLRQYSRVANDNTGLSNTCGQVLPEEILLHYYLDVAIEQLAQYELVASSQLDELSFLFRKLLNTLAVQFLFLSLIVTQRPWYLHHGSHPPRNSRSAMRSRVHGRVMLAAP